MTRKNIGVALSGGGARGFAHIGVLKVLEREHIPVDCISGTSLGGIIAAAYAVGVSLTELEDRALNLSRIRELIKLVDITPPRRGLLEGNHIREYLQNMFPEELSFEQTRIPLSLNATNLLNGDEITLNKGPLFPAIMATCSVPGIFPPVRYKNHLLVDGGVLNNIPLRQIKELGADIVIAVNAQIDPKDEGFLNEIPVKINLPLPEYLMDLYWAGFVMVSKLSRAQLKEFPPEIYIYPRMSTEINMFFGFRRAEEIIAAGEIAASAALPHIMSLLD